MRHSASRGLTRPITFVVVTVLAAALVAADGEATAPRQIPGDRLDEADTYPDRTLLATDRDVTISWQVRTFHDSLRFRLYRGPNSALLQLVTEEPAIPGVKRYQFRDVLDLLGPVLYELRVVTPGGDEMALATVLCLVPTLEPGPGVLTWQPQEHAAMTAPPAIPVPDWHRRVEAVQKIDTGFVPRPLTPPPKVTLQART